MIFDQRRARASQDNFERLAVLDRLPASSNFLELTHLTAETWSTHRPLRSRGAHLPTRVHSAPAPSFPSVGSQGGMNVRQ